MEFNCDIILIVDYRVATDALKIARNTAPYFASPLSTPDPIPCLAFDEASSWIYNFPLARDREENTISYNIECGSQTIFKAEML